MSNKTKSIIILIFLSITLPIIINNIYNENHRTEIEYNKYMEKEGKYISSKQIKRKYTFKENFEYNVCNITRKINLNLMCKDGTERK